ncbi:GLUG motif-containing protein [Bacillus benzoevorans]|uniref:GLUG domain-containing protein n=1 Tax=Bacillus benzoevorans TaxID=1456 RepID=A0A7X0LV51_9BACI|nr:GLUG motif-containing protein [Bacillus benzoevorans]MBB6445631.1 hypothetical protein [Bacillus benzoevorans]
MVIQISTPQDLDNIRNNLAGDYELTNDIDMSSFGNFIPIGKSPQFTGNIDGKGYKIFNLSIVDNSEYTAFIGRTNTGSVSNLGLENVYIESNSHHLAGLVGLNYMATISNCYVTGTIKNTNTSSLYTGGLIGRSYGLIENCYTDCTVIGGKVTGGFIGYFTSNLSTVINNYSKSTVSGGTDTGAFYGMTNTTSKPIYENNFFDKDVVGTTNYQTTGVTAKTTSEMKTQSTFTGWDFDNVWYMEDYPALRAFANIPTAKIETVNVDSYSTPIQSELNKTIKSTKELRTHSEPIQTFIQRYTATIRDVEGYLSQIHSESTQSHRSVRTGNRNVDSFVLPIGSNVYRESKTIKQLLSYVKPLQANISVLNVMRDIPIYAIVSTQKNTSVTSNEQNMSEISYIQNPSSVEVI